MKSPLKYTVILTLGIMIAFGCKKEEEEELMPTVLTESVEVLGDQSAAANGRVTNSGTDPVTERGFCWNVTGSPTTNGNVITAGTGEGEFEAIITDLQGGNTYYVRAFATNLIGTAYGEEFSITTEELLSFTYFGNTIYVHPDDNILYTPWGPPNTETGATSMGYGIGNTIDISANTPYSAAKICSDLEAFGHTNWYLPAHDELAELFDNKDQWNNFYQPYYWSSTEVSESEARAIDFENGDSVVQEKNIQRGCRCVRRN